MRRREFLTLFGGAAAAPLLFPLAAGAQKAPVIGWLGNTSYQEQWVVPFLAGLKAEGFVDGQNVTIHYRWAEGRLDRLPIFAAELVHQKVDVLVVISAAASLAAKNVTDVVPTVFVSGSDPVAHGLVASMNRPGGNRTGFHLNTHTLNAKRLELIRELMPNAATIAVLLNPNNPNAALNAAGVDAAARALGLKVDTFNVASEQDLDETFKTLSRQKPNAIVVGADSVLHNLSHSIIKRAASHAIPTVHEWREQVELGGFASYGTKMSEAFRYPGIYAGRILKGAKPSDLPVLAVC